MNYFVVPARNTEVITTLPIEANSIRGWYLVSHAANAAANRISISVDGYSLCNDVLAAPFLHSQRQIGQLAGGSADVRRYAVNACMNTRKGVVKIAPTADDMVLDVVFLVSENSLADEKEEIEYIESRFISEPSQNLHLRFEPQGFFLTQTRYNGTVTGSEVTICIDDNESNVPRFEVPMLTADPGEAWRKALWKFSSTQKIYKTLKFTADGLQQTDELEAYFYSRQNIVR